MNTLSWFLYLADRLPSLSGVVILMCVLFGIILILVSGTNYIVNHDHRENIDGKAKSSKFLEKVWFKHIPILLIPFFLALLVPTKETIYLIAGSEAGEAVVTSDEGKEILNDIHKVIKHQLSKLKGSE